jgi:type III restriction enzyme
MPGLPLRSRSILAFDSKPESHLFWTLLHDEKIDKAWFTGMLTYGQTEFYISYIDPASHTVRCYHPDFWFN